MNWPWFSVILVFAVGCDHQQRAAGALDMADYQGELKACRQKGRAAKSYEVYEACALEVDRKHKVNGQ